MRNKKDMSLGNTKVNKFEWSGKRSNWFGFHFNAQSSSIVLELANNNWRFVDHTKLVR